MFRKPKFMRNETAMDAYMDAFGAITEAAKKVESVDEKYCLLKEAGICLHKAAKAGGFFSTKDFIKWLFSQS